MVLMIFLWESLRYASLRAPPDNARMRISYQLPQYVFYVFFDPTVSSQVDLSIFYALIQVRVAGGTASKKGNPDAPLLSDTHWLLRWIPKAFPGQLRDIISPVSWSLFQDGHVITLPQQGVWEASWLCHRTISAGSSQIEGVTALLWDPFQYLSSLSLWYSHPMKKTHINRLYSWFCPFGHYLRLMTIGES